MKRIVLYTFHRMLEFGIFQKALVDLCHLMPQTGVELHRPFGRMDFSPSCVPIPPLQHHLIQGLKNKRKIVQRMSLSFHLLQLFIVSFSQFLNVCLIGEQIVSIYIQLTKI